MAAALDGIIPPINVNIILNITSIVPPCIGKTARMSSFTAWIIIFVGINNSNVVPIPINPEHNPTINVSALNIDEIFFLKGILLWKLK